MRPLPILTIILALVVLAFTARDGFEPLVRTLAGLVVGIVVMFVWRDGAKLTDDLESTTARTRIHLDGPTRKGGDPSAPVVVERPRLTLVGGTNRRRGTSESGNQ